MSFDDFYDEIDNEDEYFDNQLVEMSMDELKFYQNTFELLNSDNFLVIQQQSYYM